jgi:hypothetical protein
MKTLDELRDSSYHQELGKKLWAAYLAQQQGISVASAIKKVDGPVCDEWLMVAELALLAHESRVGHFLADQTVYDQFAKTYQAICRGRRGCRSLQFKVGETATNDGRRHVEGT